jgi:hypothetical protein
MKPNVLIATTSLVAGGLRIPEGATIDADHPAIKGLEQFFRPFTPTFATPRADPTKAELAEAAEAAGVDVKSGDTKAEIAEKIEQATG